MDNDNKDVSTLGQGLFSGLGLISSTVSGLVNNAISQSNAEAQRDWQEKMWHMQNQYNTPAAMAARMRAAGLNPYTMTGAQPAGSVGQGAMAQTLPLETPLSALRTMAEIRNINASTNVEESTVEKILRESELIRIGVERGLIDNDQAKKLIDEMWSAYEAAGYSGPTGFNIKQGESETNRNNAQADLFTQQIAESEQKVRNLIAEGNYTEALTASENYFRVYRAKFMEAQTHTERAKAEEAMANAVRAFAEADFAEANTTYLRHKNSREAAQHAMNLSMDRLRKQGMITENECAEYKLKIDKAWDEGFFGEDAKGHRLENLATMWNSFLHHNLSLSGSGSVASSSSKLIK